MGLFNRKERKSGAGAASPSTPSSSTDPQAVSTPASSSDSSSGAAAATAQLLSPNTEKRAAKDAEALAVRVQALRQKVEGAGGRGRGLDNARKRALYYEVRSVGCVVVG